MFRNEHYIVDLNYKDIFKDKLDQQSSHANEVSVSTFKTALNQALN